MPSKSQIVAVAAASVISGAALLMTNEVSPPATVQSNPIAWQYPPGATNLYWDLQSSTDLVNWTTVATDCTGQLIVTNSKPCEFFRLAGHH